jgi:hypothetical protein
MKVLKPVFWTVLGVVIGVVAILSAERVQARQGFDQRVVIIRAPQPNVGRINFVKDTRSGGCWIASGTSDGFTAIAVAPPSSCD